jgi:hypothetical protein
MRAIEFVRSSLNGGAPFGIGTPHQVSSILADGLAGMAPTTGQREGYCEVPRLGCAAPVVAGIVTGARPSARHLDLLPVIYR